MQENNAVSWEAEHHALAGTRGFCDGLSRWRNKRSRVQSCGASEKTGLQKNIQNRAFHELIPISIGLDPPNGVRSRKIRQERNDVLAVSLHYRRDLSVRKVPGACIFDVRCIHMN